MNNPVETSMLAEHQCMQIIFAAGQRHPDEFDSIVMSIITALVANAVGSLCESNPQLDRADVLDKLMQAASICIDDDMAELAKLVDVVARQ